MWTPFKENYAYGWLVSAPMPNQFGGHRRIREHGGGDQRLFEHNHSPAGAERDGDRPCQRRVSVNASAMGRDLLALFYGERYTPPRAAGSASLRVAAKRLYALRHVT